MKVQKLAFLCFLIGGAVSLAQEPHRVALLFTIYEAHEVNSGNPQLNFKAFSKAVKRIDPNIRAAMVLAIADNFQFHWDQTNARTKAVYFTRDEYLFFPFLLAALDKSFRTKENLVSPLIYIVGRYLYGKIFPENGFAFLIRNGSAVSIVPTNFKRFRREFFRCGDLLRK